jgi:hypothetical protein
METPLDLHQLAETVADHGVAAVDSGIVDDLAGRALTLGASPIIVGILRDPAEPAVARVRAFGRITGVFARPERDRFTLAA